MSSEKSLLHQTQTPKLLTIIVWQITLVQFCINLIHSLNQIDTYKNFLNGRYVAEGIRNTVGIVLPALVLNYFNLLPIGFELSLGALCVSATDSPGPVHHRLNGMFFCNLIITAVAIITCYSAESPLLLGCVIFVFGFLFSMLTVYGIRTSAIGIAALLVMILSLQTPQHGNEIWLNALYILCGGTWYLLFSMLLYTIRPYKIIQQILGDFILDIGAYFKMRSLFYKHDPEYEKTYQQLLLQQVNVQTQQSLLSEILFKTRTIIKESTHTGRVLLKIYVDVAELFESIMTTFQDYRILHKQFDRTGILEKIQEQIVALSEELNQVGIAVKSGLHSVAPEDNLINFRNLKTEFENLRLTYMTDANVEQFVSLGRILNNLQHLTEKINGLHYYTSYDKKIQKAQSESIDQSNYAASQDIRPAIFFNNLNFGSNVFRHALRVAFALLTGYVISLAFAIGHSYWILLTIVVILKPAYSLTKKRNSDRLIGTLLGILIGVGILYFIHGKTTLFVIMIVMMATCYSFLRINYFVSVLTMTPYLVLFFHMLYPDMISVVLKDRLVDTAIGSGIAFFASIFFVPAWEHESIRSFMIKMLEANKKYYGMVAAVFSSNAELPKQQFRIVRKDVLTELANVSDAFNRMLSEPKRFQKGIENVHQFVVFSHILTSHFATLSYYLNVRQSTFRSADLLPVIENTQLNFSNAIHFLSLREGIPGRADRNALDKINNHAEILLAKRREELLQGQLETDTKQLLVESKSVIDQFNHIYGVSADMAKVAEAL